MLNKSLQELYLYQNKNINEIKELTNNLNKLINEKEQQIQNIVKHTLTDTPEDENIANISYTDLDINKDTSINCYKFGKYLTILCKQTNSLIPGAYSLLFYDTELNKISLNQMLPVFIVDANNYIFYDAFTFYATEKTNTKTIYFMFYVKNSRNIPILLYLFDYDKCEFDEVETGNNLTYYDENLNNVIIFDENVKLSIFITGITNGYLYPYIDEDDGKTYGYYIFNMTAISNKYLLYLDTNGYKIKMISIEENTKFAKNISSIVFTHDTLFGDELLFKISYTDNTKLNLSTDAKTLIKNKFIINNEYKFKGELSGTAPSTCNINGKLSRYSISNNTMYFYNDKLEIINKIDITGFDSTDNKTSSTSKGINIISSPSLRWYNNIILIISSMSYLTVYKCPHDENIIMCNNYVYPNGYMFYIIKDDENTQLKVYKLYPSYGLNLQKTTKIYC